MRFPTLLVVVTVSVFSALLASCTSAAPRCRPGASCAPPRGPRVTFATTVSGRYTSISKGGRVPIFRVRPGTYLVMRVAVTVPRHTTVTALSLGISTGTYGGSPQHPTDLHPILARSRQPLTAGVHTFGLAWRIPKDHSGASLHLASVWSTNQPPESVAQAIATLALK